MDVQHQININPLQDLEIEDQCHSNVRVIVSTSNFVKRGKLPSSQSKTVADKILESSYG